MTGSLPQTAKRLAQLTPLVACFLAGCAGYHVGAQSLFPTGIRTVHVEIVETESYRRFLGQQLTEAIVKRIEQDTPFVIADPALADSILRCKLSTDRKNSQVLDRFGEPRVLRSSWIVDVNWVDRSGIPLVGRQDLKVKHREEFIPEGGQSLATANRATIQEIAHQIVGQMEAAW